MFESENDHKYTPDKFAPNYFDNVILKNNKVFDQRENRGSAHQRLTAGAATDASTYNDFDLEASLSAEQVLPGIPYSTQKSHLCYCNKNKQSNKTRKEKWNAYMRKYNARKKQEREERLNKVELCFGDTTKLYDAKLINDLLVSTIMLYLQICNSNIDKLNTETLNREIDANINDIYKVSMILQDAVKSTLN